MACHAWYHFQATRTVFNLAWQVALKGRYRSGISSLSKERVHACVTNCITLYFSKQLHILLQRMGRMGLRHGFGARGQCRRKRQLWIQERLWWDIAHADFDFCRASRAASQSHVRVVVVEYPCHTRLRKTLHQWCNGFRRMGIGSRCTAIFATSLQDEMRWDWNRLGKFMFAGLSWLKEHLTTKKRFSYGHVWLSKIVWVDLWLQMAKFILTQYNLTGAGMPTCGPCL